MPPFPNMTFDLDLWPTDLKINRDHLLIKDYLPTKFEASGAKPSWVISCTRLRATGIPTDIPTDRPTGATQYAPPFSKGGIIKTWFISFCQLLKLTTRQQTPPPKKRKTARKLCPQSFDLHSVHKVIRKRWFVKEFNLCVLVQGVWM